MPANDNADRPIDKAPPVAWTIIRRVFTCLGEGNMRKLTAAILLALVACAAGAQAQIKAAGIKVE